MATTHRGLPPPAAMTLPQPTRQPPALGQGQNMVRKMQTSIPRDAGGYSLLLNTPKSPIIIMDSASDIPMPDMNVPSNLEFYRQIIELENDASRNEILFKHLDHSQQRALLSIAHSRKLEYEYYRGCARVFRNTSSQDGSRSQSPSNVGAASANGAESRKTVASRQASLTQTPPQSSTIQETNISYCMSDDYPSLPAWDFMTNPIYNGHLQEQLTTAADNSMLNFDPLSALQPTDPASSSQFMDFSGFQQRYEPSTSQFFQQQPELMSDMSVGQAYSTDETVPIGAMMDNDPFGLEASSSSRRMSGASFTMSNSGGVVDVLSYEDFSATLPDSFVHKYDYPPPARASGHSSFTAVTPLSPAPQNGTALQSCKPASRSGSVSSLQSERGRNRISKLFKRTSNASMKSSGIGENVFDSTKIRPSSRASSGGRTGPLDKLARAGMKAVRAIGGACWRCRILGKKCSDESPCDSCPKRTSSGSTPWKAIGCRRGTLGEVMQPVNLCPRSQVGKSQPRGLILPAQIQQLAPRSPSQKAHKCPYCEAEFMRQHNLKSHLLTHSQEKPYMCQTCTTRFRRLHDLKRHVRLHRGERPHICPKCDRKFARGDALARHNKGQGICAGRRDGIGSFGADDDFEGPNRRDDGEGAMNGVTYTNPVPHDEMSEEDRRRFSLPSITAPRVFSFNATSLKRTSDGVSSLHLCKHGIDPERRPPCLQCTQQPPENADPGQMGQAFLDAAIGRRREDIANERALSGDQNTVLGPVLLTLKSCAAVEELGLSRFTPSSPYYSLTSLIPLDQCILAIIWEVLDQPDCHSVISIFDREPETALANFVVLMRSAAVYQARLEEDSHQLIAQSLICLRESLEVVRAESFTSKSTINSVENRHRNCNSTSQCQVSYIASLYATLARYIDQLSRVFFRKENLRGKTWWISVFYSLVIQSVVRQLLLKLVDHLPAKPWSIKRYLHLAVRLFIASSGEYDPLAREGASHHTHAPEEEMAESGIYEAAKLSVRQKDWKSLGIQNSGNYLQKLFEDDGLPIEGRQMDDSDPAIPVGLRSPLPSPSSFYPDWNFRGSDSNT